MDGGPGLRRCLGGGRLCDGTRGLRRGVRGPDGARREHPRRAGLLRRRPAGDPGLLLAPAAKGRHGKHGHNPHGDFEALPPGLQKQVRRNGHLPPGLARQRLPDDLERRLSPLPDGYVRVRIGTDIVLMDARTEIVLDLIRDLG
jgi:hypothetical protein